MRKIQKSLITKKTRNGFESFEEDEEIKSESADDFNTTHKNKYDEEQKIVVDAYYNDNMNKSPRKNKFKEEQEGLIDKENYYKACGCVIDLNNSLKEGKDIIKNGCEKIMCVETEYDELTFRTAYIKSRL